MGKKICVKCGIEKDISKFGNDSNRKDKHRVYCKCCSSKDGKIYYKINKIKIAEIAHENYLKNPEKKKQYEKDHKKEANACKKKYVETHPEERKQSANGYYHRNKEKVKSRLNKGRINKWRREYNATHPQAKLAKNMRTAIGRLLTGRSEGGRMLYYLGCDIIFFRNYLESQWEDNMDWTNYGNGCDKWNIDHIQPLESFNLKNEDDCKIAFNWKNCRPMWQSENCSKGSLYNGTRKHKK